MITRPVPAPATEALAPTDTFPRRHIGPDEAEVQEMLSTLGYASLEELIAATVPEGIRLHRELHLPEPRGEHELLDDLHEMAARNEVFRSFIGMGYHDCITPPVIQRNVLENPGWYTQYTPYQAEIAQGRLEALLNFQTMVADLTALPLANASLLDEATAAAEAMGMCHSLARDRGRRGFFVAEDCHPQTIAVVRTRAQPLGIEVHVGPADSADVKGQDLFGILVQYPTTDGRIVDYAALAERAHAGGALLAAGLRRLGLEAGPAPFFDTLRLRAGARAADILAQARARRINLRDYGDGSLGVSLDETTLQKDLWGLWDAFALGRAVDFTVEDLLEDAAEEYAAPLARTSPYLLHEVFNRHHSEHEMLRYLHRLQARDLSLTTSMIPLGSCTMKLNATSEMLPVTWREFAELHPFAPADQAKGYADLFTQLEAWLAEITGFAAVSLQPNAGSQGEYAGLLVIRAFHHSRGDTARDVCLIPVSAHGTNPASAVTAGFKVVVVACDEKGNIDVEDLRRKAEENRDRLGALMVTYPSTYGVFEETIREVCQVVHESGGQVYMDGANMNAQVGLTRPKDIGADVCHLNLHKTFCIPHGGGGPGMGPIGVASHLVPFLPGHPVTGLGTPQSVGTVSAAPYGSPAILVIPWVYIALMGAAGLRRASEVAILSANYMARRLESHYPVVFTGKNGRVAHEFIVDVRPFKKTADIEVDDIAKRLMDYGFHAPTMSFPVAGTLMIEPTESEPKAELDRFCDALIAIREEIRAIEDGTADGGDNALKNAPHTARELTADEWTHPYSREEAAFPAPWVRAHKFWPFVGRIDNTYGDRNLVCSCPAMEAYE
ncbi:MAG TPA: aminomethyl-transferring glycine dehydrogenase [Vicinamibacteria bacterium]|nr:aminomethyl-transferring glycine dehydrogenase [Vicinamibacteria bacterium]